MAITREDVTPNTHEMVVIHRMFRREFRLLPGLVRGVQKDDIARARVVSDHTAETIARLHTHHTGEDELLWPRLLDRAVPESDLIRRMQAQHEQVANAINQVSNILPSWAETADPATSAQLAGILTRLNTQLCEHLDEEERQILPMARQCLSSAEWDELGKHAMDGVSKSRMLLQLGGILEEANPDERQLFLGKLPRIARLIWAVIGQRRYQWHAQHIRGN